jgi:hypothetical protein
MTEKVLNNILIALNKQITYKTYYGIPNVMFIDNLALAYQSVDDNGNLIWITDIANFPKSCNKQLIIDCLDADCKNLGIIKKINWQHLQDKTFVVADIETTGYSPKPFITTFLFEINAANDLFDGKLVQIIIKLKGIKEGYKEISFSDIKKQIFEIKRIVNHLLKELEG